MFSIGIGNCIHEKNRLSGRRTHVVGGDEVSRSFQEATLLHLCKLDISMVRRGWSQVEVPNGWVQVIGGPRPKTDQWSWATKEGKLKQVLPHRQLKTPTRSSRPSPEEVANQSSTSSFRRGEGKRVRHISKSRGASPIHRAIPGPCEEEVGGGGEGSGGVHRKARFSPGRYGFYGGEARQVEGQGGSWGCRIQDQVIFAMPGGCGERVEVVVAHSSSVVAWASWWCANS